MQQHLHISEILYQSINQSFTAQDV